MYERELVRIRLSPKRAEAEKLKPVDQLPHDYYKNLIPNRWKVK